MTSIPAPSSSQSERRKRDRLLVDTPARMSDGTTFLEGTICNVASGGAAFVTTDTKSAIPVGAKVLLVAPGADEGNRDIEFSGRVVRVDALGETRSYALAFEQPIGG